MPAIQASQARPDLEAIGLRGQPTVKRNDQLGQEDFLSLMTTQLQNQDPFKPMESGQFLAQIAQFATVNGIQDLGSTVKTLSESLSSTQGLQAASLLGRKALVPGNIVSHQPGGSLEGLVDAPSSVNDLRLNVYDSAGQLVRRLELGTHPAGEIRFNWDGTLDNGQSAAPGQYAVAAEGTVNGETQGLLTLVAADVESVSLGQGGQGVTVNLGALGNLPLNEVRQLL